MRVAITGSHGFIGAAISASLQGDGHEVISISRDEVGNPDRFAGVEAVVHLGGEPIAPKR